MAPSKSKKHGRAALDLGGSPTTLKHKEVAQRIERLMQIIKSPDDPEKPISQKEFAKAIGISPSALNQALRTYRGLAINTIVKICINFNVNAQWLLIGEGDIFISFVKDKRFKHN